MKFNEIVAMICNLFLALTVFVYMESMFQERRTSRRFVGISCLVFGIVLAVLYMYVHIPIIMIAVSISGCFLITLHYRATWIKRIAITVLLYGVMMITETLVLVASNFFIPSLTSGDQYASVFGQIIIRMITFLVVLVIKKIVDIKREQFLPMRYWIFLCCVPIVTSYMTILLLEKDSISRPMVIVSVVMLLLMNAATFFAYDGINRIFEQHTKDMLLRQQNEYYKKQLDYIMESQHTVKALHHDMKNHLIAIKSLVGENDEAAFAYIDEILSAKTADKAYSSTGNVTLDAVVNYKLSSCAEHGIAVKCDAAIPPECFIAETDLVVIIGNLLDNAIEAAQKMSEGAFVHFSIRYMQNVFYITVENSFQGDLLMSENGKIKTTKADSSQHGMGIHNVEMVAAKYHGCLEKSAEEGTFTARVILFEK